MYINEVFDKMHKWSWSETKPDRWHAKFPTATGETIEVSFYREDNFVGDVWDIIFTRDDSESITGQGDALAIFATVRDIVMDFDRKVKSEFYKFGAKEPTRIRLYDRMLPILAKELGMKHERHENEFILARE